MITTTISLVLNAVHLLHGLVCIFYCYSRLCLKGDSEKEIAWFAAHSNDAKRKKRIEQQKAREAEQERLREEKRKKQVSTIVVFFPFCDALIILV